MVTVLLPETCGEANLAEFVSRITCGARTGVAFDFGEVRYYTQGALVALTALVRRYRQAGIPVEFRNVGDAPALGYLQRIDFLKLCGHILPDGFSRHDPAGRFVTLRQLEKSEDAIGAAAFEIAQCISPWEDPEEPAADFCEQVTYSISELGNNVFYHSLGDGFASAQFIPKRKEVSVAISDNGIGIRKSFVKMDLLPEGTSDREAIQHALRRGISSRAHMNGAWGESPNQGVGLTYLLEVMDRTGGSFFIASGTGYGWKGKDRDIVFGDLEAGSSFPGTICSLMFRRNDERSFAQVFEEIRQDNF